jgi:hypothetical protein
VLALSPVVGDHTKELAWFGEFVLLTESDVVSPMQIVSFGLTFSVGNGNTVINRVSRLRQDPLPKV